MKMRKQHIDQMARKYRNRAGDAAFVDATKLRMSGDDVGAELAKYAHDAMFKLIRHLESRMEK